MRFPTNYDDKKKGLPWVLNKITYIETQNNYDFIQIIRQKEEGDKYIFELCDKNLFVNKLFNKEPEEIFLLIPYYAPKYKLTNKEISYIQTVNEVLKNPIIYNSLGYVNYPDNLISGFANRTYFSLSEDALIETIENNASIEFKSNEKESLNSGVLFSSFSNSFANSIKFQSDLSKITLGRSPLDLDEIVVSSGLLKSLNGSDITDANLYISTAVKEINKNAGIFNRQYQTVKLKIVGLVEDENNYIYHNQYWTEDYFALKNGQKVSGLITNSISFSIPDEVNADEIVTKLRRAFPQYEIINPLLGINESVDQLCNSISIFILCISLVALIISLILLSSCTYLHIQDIKKEIALARCIGINVDESLKFLHGYTIYSSLFSLVVSSLELTFSNFIILQLSSDTLGLPFKFSITIFAYVVMAVACIVICLFSTSISAKHIKKIKPIDCLKI